MYARHRFQTGLSVSQALERLARVIRTDSTPPFAGRIERHRFTMRRRIPYRNDFAPVICGQVVPDGSGARIDLVFKVTVPVAVIMIVGFGVAAAGVAHSIQASEARALMTLVLPLFSGLLLAIGFFPEKRTAIRILSDALAEPPRSARVNAVE
jgi:hypothetical protein